MTMMEDPGYSSYQDPRLQPPEEYDDPVAEFDRCTHRFACMRLYRTFVDDAKYAGWLDEMCRRMCCGEDCDEFEEAE